MLRCVRCHEERKKSSDESHSIQSSCCHVSNNIKKFKTYIDGEAAMTKERRKPRAKRLAATGGAGRTTKEKLYIIGCVYDVTIFCRREDRVGKSRPKSACTPLPAMNSVRKRQTVYSKDDEKCNEEEKDEKAN